MMRRGLFQMRRGLFHLTPSSSLSLRERAGARAGGITFLLANRTRIRSSRCGNGRRRRMITTDPDAEQCGAWGCSGLESPSQTSSHQSNSHQAKGTHSGASRPHHSPLPEGEGVIRKSRRNRGDRGPGRRGAARPAGRENRRHAGIAAFRRRASSGR